MILHAAALAFAVAELTITIVAWRSWSDSALRTGATLLMVFAMADSGLIGARVVPAVGWSALLASMAMAMAFAGRLRRQGHGSQGTGRGGLAGLEVTLGLLAMAAIQFAGATTSEAHTLTTSGHAHAPIGMALVAIGIALLLVLAGLAFRHRSVTERPSRHQTAARACMLCSLTAMTMAIVV